MEISLGQEAITIPLRQFPAGSNVKRPNYQHTISSTSGESIQPNRCTQIMTMIQCSGSSLGMSPDSSSRTFTGAQVKAVIITHQLMPNWNYQKYIQRKLE